MTWLIKAEASHTCDLPRVRDADRHREGEQRASDSNRNREAAYQRDLEAYNAASARERRNMVQPREPGHWGRYEHDCERDKCHVIRDGSVWRCDDCGLTYELARRQWQRVSLIRPEIRQNQSTRRTTNADSCDPTLAFVAGAVLL